MLAARFERPSTLDDATGLLADGGWSVLAGGTDLYPASVGRPIAAPLLDITGVAGLRGVREDAMGWWFGATTTWTDVLRAPLPPLFDGLKQAAREVGGAQIQNTGTIGGNLCNASPAADGTPAWLALDARVVLCRQGGERRVPVADFVLGNRRTVLAPGELLVALFVPARGPRARSVFLKLGGRRYLTISITMVALALDVNDAGAVAWAGAAVGSCSARALRLPLLERRLIGASLDDARVEAADLAPLTPIDDMRASAGYRLDATGTLLRRALGRVRP